MVLKFLILMKTVSNRSSINWKLLFSMLKKKEYRSLVWNSQDHTVKHLSKVSEWNLLIVVISSTLLKQLPKRHIQRKKAIGPDHLNRQPSKYICTNIRFTCILRYSPSEFFRLSRCPSHTYDHIEYPSSVCVCTHVYKHKTTHRLNTCKNREIYKT